MRTMKKVLITGATGFIGKALTRRLAETENNLRVLIHPSRKTPDLPRGVPVEAAVSSFSDMRGLRAALVDVDVVYHLASAEAEGARGDLLENDIQGTRNLIRAAENAGIDRFFFLSHLGADRASAFPVLTAKGIAEDHIQKSSLDYTILRTGLVFGPGDRFTEPLVRLIQRIPFVFPLPDQGQMLLQPLWVEDLANLLLWSLDQNQTRHQKYEIGGPEHLSLREIITILLNISGLKRTLLPTSLPLIRFATLFADYISLDIPTNVFWLDYLAANRTCSLTTIPEVFHLLPSRFGKRLGYLNQESPKHTE